MVTYVIRNAPANITSGRTDRMRQASAPASRIATGIST